VRAARDGCAEVELLVGLPPQHFMEMRPKYENYFRRGERVNFTIDQRLVSVRIAGVHIYVQAFCAALTVLGKFNQYEAVNVVDIGGHTTDSFPLDVPSFTPDMKRCKSLKFGLSLLYERINHEIQSRILGLDMPYSAMEKILEKSPRALNTYGEDWQELVFRHAGLFTKDLLAELGKAGIELKKFPTVFVGGGSIALREYIEESGLVEKPIFAGSVYANAEGYILLHSRMNKVMG
jgi:plasmid segregation protein ParM